MGTVIPFPRKSSVPVLLAALAAVVRRHRTDPEAGGLAAVRALRAAGATWADVLPGIAPWVGHVGERTPFIPTAGASLQAAILVCGRLDAARPFALAELAVILASPRTAAGDARAWALVAEHDAVLELEHQAEVTALLASAPGA